ncbi:hypothetical protein CYMTET_12287 [Cymbomonas tetramitiformis]|uniref:Uncharacterized protein n=1 Tax=Cymbomonas tetramitiformis TaxID=36881 RepID=A0AAE0GKE5_9CHLO|nr:hypothetical protein CYMTET_12287 [Cymbomonas tetramitiformis]
MANPQDETARAEHSSSDAMSGMGVEFIDVPSVLSSMRSSLNDNWPPTSQASPTTEGRSFSSSPDRKSRMLPDIDVLNILGHWVQQHTSMGGSVDYSELFAQIVRYLKMVRSEVSEVAAETRSEISEAALQAMLDQGHSNNPDVEQLRASLQARDATNEALQAKVEALQSDLNNVSRASTEGLPPTEAKLREDLADLKSKLDESELKCGQYRATLSAAEERLEQMYSIHEDQVAHIMELQQSKLEPGRAAVKELADLKSKLVLADRERDVSVEHTRAMALSLQAREKELTDATAASEELSQQLLREKEISLQRDRELKRLRRESSEPAASKSPESKKIRDLELQLTELHEQFAQKGMELAKAQQRLASMEDTASMAQLRSELDEQMSESDRERASWKESTRLFREQLELQQAELARILKKVSETSEADAARVASYEAHLADRDSRLAAACKEKEQLSGNIQQLQRKLANMEKNIEITSVAEGSVRTELQQMESEKSMVQTELSSSQGALQRSEAELGHARDELSRAQADLQLLKSTHSQSQDACEARCKTMQTELEQATRQMEAMCNRPTHEDVAQRMEAVEREHTEYTAHARALLEASEADKARPMPEGEACTGRQKGIAALRTRARPVRCSLGPLPASTAPGCGVWEGLDLSKGGAWAQAVLQVAGMGGSGPLKGGGARCDLESRSAELDKLRVQLDGCQKEVQSQQRSIQTEIDLRHQISVLQMRVETITSEREEAHHSEAALKEELAESRSKLAERESNPTAELHSDLQLQAQVIAEAYQTEISELKAQLTAAQEHSVHFEQRMLDTQAQLGVAQMDLRAKSIEPVPVATSTVHTSPLPFPPAIATQAAATEKAMEMAVKTSPAFDQAPCNEDDARLRKEMERLVEWKTNAEQILQAFNDQLGDTLALNKELEAKAMRAGTERDRLDRELTAMKSQISMASSSHWQDEELDSGADSLGLQHQASGLREDSERLLYGDPRQQDVGPGSSVQDILAGRCWQQEQLPPQPPDAPQLQSDLAPSQPIISESCESGGAVTSRGGEDVMGVVMETLKTQSDELTMLRHRHDSLRRKYARQSLRHRALQHCMLQVQMEDNLAGSMDTLTADPARAGGIWAAAGRPSAAQLRQQGPQRHSQPNPVPSDVSPPLAGSQGIALPPPPQHLPPPLVDPANTAPQDRVPQRFPLQNSAAQPSTSQPPAPVSRPSPQLPHNSRQDVLPSGSIQVTHGSTGEFSTSVVQQPHAYPTEPVASTGQAVLLEAEGAPNLPSQSVHASQHSSLAPPQQHQSVSTLHNPSSNPTPLQLSQPLPKQFSQPPPQLPTPHSPRAEGREGESWARIQSEVAHPSPEASAEHPVSAEHDPPKDLRPNPTLMERHRRLPGFEEPLGSSCDSADSLAAIRDAAVAAGIPLSMLTGLGPTPMGEVNANLPRREVETGSLPTPKQESTGGSPVRPSRTGKPKRARGMASGGSSGAVSASLASGGVSSKNKGPSPGVSHLIPSSARSSKPSSATPRRDGPPSVTSSRSHAKRMTEAVSPRFTSLLDCCQRKGCWAGEKRKPAVRKGWRLEKKIPLQADIPTQLHAE